jgi:hypothetical protein
MTLTGRFGLVGTIVLLLALARTGAGTWAMRGVRANQDPASADGLQGRADSNSEEGKRRQDVGNASEVAPPSPALALAATTPDSSTPPDAAEPPRVLSMHPANGSTGIEPVTEIRIRFDQPMDPTAAWLEWHGQQAGYQPCGEMRYVAETHEFILPVVLSPTVKHELSLNREAFSSRRDNVKYTGFRSASGMAAKPQRWSFTTVGRPGIAGKPPRATSLHFPNVPSAFGNTAYPPYDPDRTEELWLGLRQNVEVGLITRFDLTFDQPMDPNWGSVRLGDSRRSGRRPDLLGRPEYDAKRQRFTLLVHLPPNWNGDLRFVGFRSKGGVEAPEVSRDLRTRRSIFASDFESWLETAGKSPVLREVVDRVRKTRRNLTSLSEEARESFSMGILSPEWRQTYAANGSRFAMQGERKFLGVVDDTMQQVFRVGSDGTTCWLRLRNELITIPAGEIREKNLLFCDPFDASNPASTEKIIQIQKLQYLGEQLVSGRRCHRTRSWALHFGEIDVDQLSPFREWFIDTETFLPQRVVQMGPTMNVTHAIDYVYSRVNQPIDDAVFRPDQGPAVKDAPPLPLDADYTRRTLNVRDGSTGRISVRWGVAGPKGAKSSGYN